MHIKDRIRELRRVRACQLKPNPRNWRTHPKAQREALQGLLAEVGFADALLARELEDGSLELIDGHLRAETTPEMDVPVLVLDVTEAEANVLLASIDPLAALAGADAQKLEELLSSVATSNDAVQAMLDRLAKNAGVERLTGELVEDEPPEPLKKAVARKGDLWVLGNHRLLCGDSTRVEDVRRVMDGQQAALVATDPPYLVDYTGERPEIAAGSGRRGGGGKDWSGTYKEVDIKDAAAFFNGVFRAVLDIIAPHAAIYCWHAHKRQALIARVWEELGILDHQQIVWVKPTSVFGRVFWHFRHEPCMMGWVKGSMPSYDNDHSVNSVWEINWEGKNRVFGNEHPTQKPLEIFARPMRKHTKPGAICFEPFSGSGSQLVAAEQLDRRCFAIELEPVFIDVAIRRWQKLTGKAATLEGVPWMQVAKSRKVKLPAEVANG
ncbi:MAG: DNA modification methylase [Phycisphaeraceae bacterium]|nr:DNA modification methylase [Phycisphaeraceae bacterium]